MSKAVGILELSSIAKGMETGDAMLKSANVELLVSKTLCPGKFLLMLGGDVGAVQQAINSGASLAGEMLVDSLVPPNIHPSLLSAISGLNHVEQHRAVGVVETRSVAACIDAADCAVKAANVILVRVHMALALVVNATWWLLAIFQMLITRSLSPASGREKRFVGLSVGDCPST